MQKQQLEQMKFHGGGPRHFGFSRFKGFLPVRGVYRPGSGGLAELRPHRLGQDPQSQRGFLRILVHQHGAAGLPDGRSHVAHYQAPPLVAGHVVLSAQPVQIIIEKAVRAGNQLAKRLAAVGLNVTVRVMRPGHHRHAHSHARGQQGVERPHGGLLPSLVGIKAQNHFLHIALDDARVLVGEGRALGRDDVLHPRHEAGD